MTTSTDTASTVFEQLATLFGNEAFQAINPIVVATLADIEANPQAWLNPLSAPIKGAAAVAGDRASHRQAEDAARERAGKGPLGRGTDDQLAQGPATVRVRYDRLGVIIDAWATLAASVICFRILHHDVI